MEAEAENRWCSGGERNLWDGGEKPAGRWTMGSSGELTVMGRMEGDRSWRPSTTTGMLASRHSEECG